MHEGSIAARLLDLVLRRAAEEGARRVVAVRGTVADTEALSPGSLALHFEARAAGTIAAGARLDLDVVHVEARCERCGERYAPDHHVLLCPRCGATEATLLGQEGVTLRAIELDVG